MRKEGNSGLAAFLLGLHAVGCSASRPSSAGAHDDGGSLSIGFPIDAATEEASPVGDMFASLGARALGTMQNTFYAGGGKWHSCIPIGRCGDGDQDWGDDALTYALFVRWDLTRDATILPTLKALNESGHTYGSCTLGSCGGWSDVPLWDAVAAAREYEALGDASALVRAEAAFTFVDASNAFAAGACPEVDYQQPGGGANQLKTLESDSNYIKAALLLYAATGSSSYLTRATKKYVSVRKYFLDPSSALYTVYVVDDGSSCSQIPGRFFGSVNGNMIWSGLLLADATGDATYRDDALATAHAVVTLLSDPSGLYENLQAENDVTEPLVEAFLRLATADAEPFARSWLLTNASASVSDIASDGTYGRFWGGPAPTGTTTIWQTNGGLALAFAAAALAPSEAPEVGAAGYWASATMTNTNVTTLPDSIRIEGRGVALFGTIGESCCESGHARIFVDGVETVDKTGIWQNKSSSGQSLPGSVLFAWRWPSSGSHTLSFEPGVANGKEGTSFLHIQAYEAVP